MDGPWLSAASLLCLTHPRLVSGGFEPKYADDHTFASEDPADYQVILTVTLLPL